MGNNSSRISDDPELVVAAVALVVSVVALIGTILQVLQQYFGAYSFYTRLVAGLGSACRRS